MPSKPRYSILILMHNRFEETKRCFESLTATAARPDVEVNVYDNGSSYTKDELLVLTGLLPGAFFAWSNINHGVAAGRQHLLSSAFGDIIVFLDSDTVIAEPGWIDQLGEALEPENVGLVGPNGCNVTFLPQKPFTDYYLAEGECDVISGWCQAFKAEVIRAGVRLDTEYGLFWDEDSDFCLQIREAGWDVVCTGWVGVKHTPGQSGNTGPEQRARTLQRMHDKWAGKGIIHAEGGY